MQFFKSKLQIILSSAIAILAVAAIAGATTIGTNISTDGTLDVAGNVGIGNTNPTGRLSVSYGGNVTTPVASTTMMSNGNIYLPNVGGIYFGNVAGTSFKKILFRNQPNNYVELAGGSGDTLFVLDTNNRIGIGAYNSDPNAINGNTGSVSIYNGTPTTGATSVSIRAGVGQGSIGLFGIQNYNANNYFTVDASGNIGISATTTSYAKFLVNGTTGQTGPLLAIDYSANGTATSSAMYIDSSGNVGIGTTSPSVKLNVVGRLGLTFGTNNLFIGIGTGNETLTGSYDIAIGDGAGAALTTGLHEVMIGGNAGLNWTSGNYNTFVGTGAGKGAAGLSTGERNVAIGRAAGYAMTTANNNVFVGENSGGLTTSGSMNAFVGRQAGYNNLTGQENSILGYSAGNGAASASYSKNLILGAMAGYVLSTGSNNIILGWATGDTLTTGANNIVIGHDINLPAVDSANMLDIGNLIYATGLTSTGTTVSTGNVGIGTTSPAATLDIEGYMRLKKNLSEPAACSAANAGALAMNSSYIGCVCNGSSWTFFASSTQACVW